MSEERKNDAEAVAGPAQPDDAEPGVVTPETDDSSVSPGPGEGVVPDGEGVGSGDSVDSGAAGTGGPSPAETDASEVERPEPADAAPAPKAESAPQEHVEDATAGQAEEPHEMTFTEHLNELRVRLTRCIIAAFVGFLACYAFAEDLFRMLMEPLLTLLAPTGGALIYTGLPEAFFTHLKVAAIAGLFVASPYIFYELWMFIAPGLYEGERKYMIPVAICSAACFVTGALFGYFVVFPFGFQFFLGYASDMIRPMPSVKEYFSFSTSMLFAFGLIFELPLFMFFLSVMGLVTHVSLRKFRKFAILGNFVVAAILTPPDVVSQCLMAGPLCLLYEVGIWVAYVFGKKPKAPEVEADAKAEA